MSSTFAVSLCGGNPRLSTEGELSNRMKAFSHAPRSSFLGSKVGAFRGSILKKESLRKKAAASVHCALAGDKLSAGEFTTVKLGKSDVEVPLIGIGSWSWGDKFFWNDGDWGDRQIKDTREAYKTALTNGLFFFDTAEVYGTKQFGADDSESILGRFVKEFEGEYPIKPIIATKHAPLPWRLGKDSVVKTLKDSLRRLQLSSIDLYQLHWPGIWGNEGYIDGLAEAVELGLTRAVGVSNYTEERLRKAHAQLAKRGIPLASNQVHYNLLYRLPENNGVKKACEELGISLIAYSPISQGVLSGKYTPENPPKGPRGNSYTKDFLTKAKPVLNRLRELGEKYDKTPTQVALNWLIVQGNIIPIPGAKNKKQAEEFIGASGWSLTEEEVEELREYASKVPPVQGFPVESF